MSIGAGDTPPRVELPRPATGAAISPTPPDTRRPTVPRAPRFRRVRAHAIPASHLPVNALRPRSRPDYRTARATSRHHRRCSSVRSPAGVARRRHGGRPATRHPHCASLLRCRCGRPAAVFRSPVWQPRRLPPTRPRANTRGACVRTPYRLRNRPATRRCAEIRPGARVAGLADGASRMRLVAAARIRTGTVAAAHLPQRNHAGQRTGRRVAGSLRAGRARRRFHVPSVAAAPLRADGCHQTRPRAHTRGACKSTPYGTATVAARALRDDKTQRPCGSRWPSRTVAAVRLPQRNHAGQRVGTPKVASDQAAGRFGFRSARRRFQVPSVAAAPLRADGCHATGRGRQQPCQRGAVFARGYTPQPARPPSLPAAATPRHDQHQCKLPRQLSAEGLARAFAPRRATGGLVRIPPASVANGGESRSLGEGYTPPS